MIITDINLRELKPSEGMHLTNGIDIAEGAAYLGKGDSADNWYEITEEEYQQKMAEKEADIEGEEANPWMQQ